MGIPIPFPIQDGHNVTVSPDDTNPAYHGIGMFTGEGLFRHFGTTLVNATTQLPNIEVFASDQQKNIVVINKDPSVPQTANIQLKGMPFARVEVWRKDNSVPFPDRPKELETINVLTGNFTYTFPPFSITTFIL